MNRGQLLELVTMAKFTALLLVVYLACFMIMVGAKPLEKAKAVEKRFIFTTAAIGTAMTATAVGTVAMLPPYVKTATWLTAATSVGTAPMLPLCAGASIMHPIALLAMGVSPC
ncbi:hypothetical protein PoB_003472700 [Plakobranchus ocellatus]|uniref:Uncharacterized protein n=1 Tax=Plakobranchus ocellatus TaxID=259542 RepID=A0AAV4AMM0_9GAST|nr:hypothetical protein PoB_003472700 [Plakobranchus ocellatus]